MYQLELVFWLLVHLQLMYLQYNMYSALQQKVQQYTGYTCNICRYNTQAQVIITCR